ADYADRGVVLHEVAGGFQFRTNPMNAHWVREVVAGKPVKLTRAQLEVLAIVASRQPITRPEVDEIRGVDSGGTMKVLLDRGLIRVLGKKEEPGRPMLYGTSKEFLEFFNLKDLKDLPTLREFYELSEDSMAKIRELDELRREEAQTAAGRDRDSRRDASPALPGAGGRGVAPAGGDADRRGARQGQRQAGDRARHQGRPGQGRGACRRQARPPRGPRLFRPEQAQGLREH